jgi:AmiR/NasT family two-component response regulator
MGDLDECREEVENLHVAVETRDVIGQAKGVLIERHAIDADEAFQMLVDMSQRQNRKLHDIAEEIATPA